MPEMDGFEATRLIREKDADIPIIGLTAHALEGDRERCLEADWTITFPKPVTAAALNEKVAFWVRHHPFPLPIRAGCWINSGGNAMIITPWSAHSWLIRLHRWQRSRRR